MHVILDKYDTQIPHCCMHRRIWGGMPAHTPLRDPILSFSHTFSLESAQFGSQTPPKMGPHPLREILDPALVCIYCLVMISIERSDTTQKSALEIWGKFSLRQNVVQDKIQSENFFPMVRKKFLDWILSQTVFVSDWILSRAEFVLDWILSWITCRSCILYAIF